MHYEYDPHSWIKCSQVGRERCIKCGLLALHNKFTRWCIKMGCDNSNHPKYIYERNNCGG